MPHLVLIETSGTQAYIFATNRLRQNVGASELCYRAGTEWVLEAVARVADRPSLWVPDTVERSRRLLDPALNPPLTDGEAGIEVIVATSARAVVLVGHPDAEREARMAREIVTIVTSTALERAPGLGVTGVVRRLRGRQELPEALTRARTEIEDVRAGLPAPAERFLRLPPIASCATTGLPAAEWRPPLAGEPPEAMSPVAASKLAAADLALERMRQETATSARAMLDRDVGQIERHLAERWVAVVHADGNGMGRVFGQLGRRAAERGTDYAGAYRELSLALEVATLRAFDAALSEIARERGQLLLVPLVLGGDDLTVLCAGQRALPFVRRYLGRFEDECRNGVITLWSGGGLTAAAGIAIVKPHFPFHAAYDLAEGLLDGAKRWSRREAGGSTSFDFLLLHDSVAGDVQSLRADRWTSRDRSIALWAGPYLLASEGAPAGRHDAAELDRRVEAIRALDSDTGRRRIPRTVLHDLRTALVGGRDAATARLALALPAMAGADGSNPLEELLVEGRLWWEEAGRLVSPVVDAMDVTRLIEEAQ